MGGGLETGRLRCMLLGMTSLLVKNWEGRTIQSRGRDEGVLGSSRARLMSRWRQRGPLKDLSKKAFVPFRFFFLKHGQ